MFTYGEETYRLAYPSHPSICLTANNAYISYGLPFAQACAKHLATTFVSERVYVLCSRSLAEKTPALEELQKELGPKVAAVRLGMRQHTHWSEVVEIVNECREKKIDAIITLGAGSLTDAAKLITLVSLYCFHRLTKTQVHMQALANDVHEPNDLRRFPSATTRGTTTRPNPSTLPFISIPTSLSGGEFSNFSGATEDSTSLKYQFGPLRGPNLIIIDPGLTTFTPERLWLASGVRAVDHCTETLCALGSNEESDALASSALRSLVEGLTRCKAHPEDLDARLLLQLAVADAMGCVFLHMIHAGASHAIGHMLGPLGVSHGETSCVILPAVCKYNYANGPAEAKARQEQVLALLWELDAVKALRLEKEKADLGDVLDAVFRSLGMPRSLKEVGVEGRERLETLAEHTLKDFWCDTNPVPLKTKEQVMQILEMAKE